MNKTLKRVLLVWLILYAVFFGVTVYSAHAKTIDYKDLPPNPTLWEAYYALPVWDRILGEAVFNPLRYIITGLLAFGGVKTFEAIQRRKTQRTGR